MSDKYQEKEQFKMTSVPTTDDKSDLQITKKIDDMIFTLELYPRFFYFCKVGKDGNQDH